MTDSHDPQGVTRLAPEAGRHSSPIEERPRVLPSELEAADQLLEAALQRSGADPMRAAAMQRLQQQVGNQVVQRLVDRSIQRFRWPWQKRANYAFSNPEQEEKGTKTAPAPMGERAQVAAPAPKVQAPGHYLLAPITPAVPSSGSADAPVHSAEAPPQPIAATSTGSPAEPDHYLQAPNAPVPAAADSDSSMTDEPPDYNTAPLPAEATSTTEELEHYNTQPTPDPGNLVGGINLKDKSLAGVKTPRIYDAFSIRELALKSKYKRLKLLDPAYVGETRNFGQQKQPGELPGGQAHGFNTKYLKEEGREKFRLTIEKGELSQTSQVANPDKLPVVKQRGEKFKTTGMDPVGSAFTENATVSYDTALFVMDPMGGLFAAPQRMSRFHHSSLLAGGPVACAGLMKVEGGRLTTIDNNSGHYKPEPENLLQVMDELSERGLMPNTYKVDVSYLDFKNTLRTQNFPPDNTPEAFYLVGKANQLETILPGYRPGPEPLAATAALMHHYGFPKNEPAAPA